MLRLRCLQQRIHKIYPHLVSNCKRACLYDVRGQERSPVSDHRRILDTTYHRLPFTSSFLFSIDIIISINIWRISTILGFSISNMSMFWEGRKWYTAPCNRDAYVELQRDYDGVSRIWRAMLLGLQDSKLGSTDNDEVPVNNLGMINPYIKVLVVGQLQ